MKRIISFKLAGNLSIAIMGLLMIFHIIMLSGLLPTDIIWGGRQTGAESMRQMELVSLAVTCFFIFIIMLKMNYLPFKIHKKVTTIVLWLMFVWFLLNIIGNLAAATVLEKSIFTPVSIVLMLLILRLAIEK